MILADKIINERKKNGWSQEELADKLGVSRQSVSKWEGAQSIPDIQKIIQMAGIFEVSTDYLLKDEIECTDLEPVVSTYEDSETEVVRVSMEDANEYIELEKKYSPHIANGVTLCITCPVVLIFLAGCSEYLGLLSENLAAGIGLITLFAMVISAVCIFIKSGNALSKYEFLKTNAIETEYGVTGMVKERKAAFASKNELGNIIGVAMCIACAIPLLIAALAEASEFVLICMVCTLLITIGIAVNIFVRVGSINESYNKLLQEGEFSVKKKKDTLKAAPFISLYWMITLAIYLGWSFYTQNWGYTWIVWPIAGFCFAAYKQVIDIIMKNKA